MRAMTPTSRTGAKGLVGRRLSARRVALRGRSYADIAFNRPVRPGRSVPITTPDGTTLRACVYGPDSADVIVFVHGWTCCVEYWNPQINAFAGDYRVVAYDQRGHGDSELGGRPLTTDLLADDLRAVLDAVLRPGQRAVLVGHSMGGMTIQAWAARYPDQVAERAAAVVLTNTAAGNLIAETTLVPLLRLLPLPLRLLVGKLALSALLPFPPVAPMQWGLRRGVMTLAAVGDVADFAFAVVRACPPRVRGRFGALLAGLDVGQAAKRLTVPTTVIAGRFDNLTPVVHSERLVEMLTESGVLDRFTVLPTGHLGSVEAYPAFNAELSRVLESAYPAREATA
ncbi:alpha/beta fold hydrolase [Nocardia alni]|uniref:alpha/beta fold hydrolase n=1 Tax=Nocardia alni TaxID=2815723 RepID=UPI0020B23F46|nr:alpha/beta hydrolase [Nocardia alni]